MQHPPIAQYGAPDQVDALPVASPDSVWVDLPRRSGVAAYVQIEEELAERIRSGMLQCGDRIPPERELAEQMQVSRMTVRQALGRLADRGLLVRQPGRGTFVSEPKLVQSLSRLSGFYDQVVSHGMLPTSRLLSAEEITAGVAVADVLGLRLAEPLYRVVRLRFVAGVPLVLETSFFPARLVPGLLDHDLEQNSIYRLMERYDARPSRAIQSLEPVPARAEEAAAVEVAEGTPVMLVERTGWDGRGRAVEYAKDIYRGDRSRFVAELHFDGDPFGGGADVPTLASDRDGNSRLPRRQEP
jgi:GntR family transcriptional regulator